MRAVWFRRAHSADGAQSIVETALVLPFLLLIVFNAVNFSYYFYVALNLAGAPREAVEYSIQGTSTPATVQPADAGPYTTNTTVSGLAYANLLNSLKTSVSETIQVCSMNQGLNNPGTASQTSKCTSYAVNGTGATFPAVPPDPEGASFVLNRVYIQYTVAPLIPAAPFGIQVLGNYSFRRQVSMRQM